MFETGDWQDMQDPQILTADLPTDDSYCFKEKFTIGWSEHLKKWTAPFMMGIINTRVVARSAALMAEYGSPYGKNFNYREFHLIGRWWNPFAALVITTSLWFTAKLGNIAFYRKIIKNSCPAPGKGPSEKSINAGSYSVKIRGMSKTGKSILVSMIGKGDPGNMATVKFLCESAFCLAKNFDELPGGVDRCGFLTPATGLGSLLVKRLKNKGLTIAIEN
jgi:short subunit dehydrogenase-like uncharacterized protein